MKISIKNKLLMCFTALILVSIIAQNTFNLFFADSLYATYKKQYMEQTFYEIKSAYDGNIDSLVTVIENIEDVHNIQIEISSQEEILYTTYMEQTSITLSDMNNWKNNDSISDEGNEDTSLEEYKLYEGTPQAEIMQRGNNEEILSLTGSFGFEEEIIYVNMMLPIASLENSVNFFTNINAIIGVIIFLVGMLIASTVSKSITKPIEKIEKITYKLSNLEFDEYIIENNTTKEIESLACSINRMSKELSGKIEDLNLANEKLHQDVENQMRLEQMRKEFVANVSHEMKTPLAILQFYCENLKSDISGIDKEYYYDTIIEETKRMDEMVKSMLDISSLEHGLAQIHLEEMDLGKTLKRTVMKLQPLLVKFEIIMNIEHEFIIWGDYRYLEQAIKNYITNAASHTSEGSCIRISLVKEDTFAKVCVYNEGEQIQEEQKERIWESFYKSDQARVRMANTNVGLGLYIVKSIIENHNGTYGVSNIENGVEFSFSIPIVE